MLIPQGSVVAFEVRWYADYNPAAPQLSQRSLLTGVLHPIVRKCVILALLVKHLT